MTEQADRDRVRGYVQQGFDWITEHGAKHGLDLGRVNLDTLATNTMDVCVLAQAAGRPYEDILFAIYMAGVADGNTNWCQEHGFVVPGYEDLVDYGDQCWRDLLTPEAAP